MLVTCKCHWRQPANCPIFKSAAPSFSMCLYLQCTEALTACWQDGQLIVFTEMEGIPELNEGKPWRIKNVKVTLLQFRAQPPMYSAWAHQATMCLQGSKRK